jgi:hypothetical protein
MRLLNRPFQLCLVFGVLAAVRADATPVLEFTPSTFAPFSNDDATIGWSFKTNQAFAVTSLDLSSGFALPAATDVRLYDGSGTVLASAMVSTADTLEGSPEPFYAHAITPVSLSAGVTYYIAADDPATPARIVNYDVRSLTVNPAVTYVGSVATFGPPGSFTFGSNPTRQPFT